jgi:hypothetical protein
MWHNHNHTSTRRNTKGMQKINILNKANGPKILNEVYRVPNLVGILNFLGGFGNN